MWLSLLSVLPNKRQAVWDADLKAVRGGSSVGQTGLLLGDPLFSKELENMGRQLAGRHYFCVVWHVCVCCVCVCQPLMTLIAGKSDQMEFGKVKHVRAHVPCEASDPRTHCFQCREKNATNFSERFIFVTVSNLSDVCMTQRFSLRGNQTRAWNRIPDLASDVCTSLGLLSRLVQTPGGLFVSITRPALPLWPFEGLRSH